MTDEPKSLRDAQVLQQRLGMLHDEHIAPLTLLVEKIRRERAGAIVPYFDPLDGGTNARVLFLLEAPGPNAKYFISRNNPDETAKNMFELQRTAEIARRDTIFWNVVPWYIGDGRRIRASRSADFDQGRPYLEQVLALLSQLRAIVLLGDEAQRAWDRANPAISGASIHRTHHTSPLSLNTDPVRRQRVLDLFRQIAANLRQ